MSDLSTKAVELMTSIRLFPAITLGKLARITNSTPGTVEQTINGLLQQGLVEVRQHPDHRGAGELRLTLAGVQALDATS